MYKRPVLKAMLWGLVCSAFFSCRQQKESKTTGMNFPDDYTLLYPKYREWPSPAENMEVDRNPAVLLWPAAEGKKVTYDVRLSRDSTFKDEGTISKQHIAWTVFNPHQELSSGTWFWQYRKHEGKWSEILKFRIPENAVVVNAPPVEKFWSSVPKAHPRVLVDQEGAIAFAKNAGNTKDAAIIIKKARALLNETPPEENEGLPTLKGETKAERTKIAKNASRHASGKVYKAIGLFCKAYILTGDKAYAEKGMAWALAVAGWDPEGVSHLSDFGDSECMVSMAWAYDTFYDLLTPDQKLKLRKSIQARANGFYNEWVNKIDAKLLSNHVWQYILDEFFQTAVALYGETGQAKDWIHYAYELWLARFPILGGSDGGWAGGAAYFRINMRTLLNIPMTIKKYTGFDFFNADPWYRKNPDWMIFSFPPGSASDGFGDDIEKVNYPGPFYLAYADALSKLTGNRKAAWYVNKIRQQGHVKPEDDNEMRWFRMRYLQDLREPDPVADSSLPSAMLFDDIGVVDMHSDISDTKNDLMIAMRSSPYGSYSHMMADQNTFNVLYGGQRLFYTSGYKIAMQDPHRLKWYKATIGHNGILIDHKGQPFGTDAYGWIPRFINGHSLTYAVGDASMAYGGRSQESTGLKKFRRHLLFIRPDILVVYDELSADHAAKWTWLIHSPQKIRLDTAKNTFYCELKNASAVSSLFTLQPVHWELTDTFATPPVNWLGRRDKEGNLKVYKNNSWHLSAVTRNGSAKMRFLAIIKVNTKEDKGAKELNYHMDNNKDIIIGDWRIRATLDTSKPALLQAFRQDGKVAFSSAGKKLNTGNRQFTGKIDNSSKLAEFVQGKWMYKETGDDIPDVVKEIPVRPGTN